MTKIQVVDDSASMRKIVIASLRVIPETTFTEATNGLEATEKLTLQHFDVIMLDMNLPDIYGMEVLQFVRNQLNKRNIPVVVLTNRTDDLMRSWAIEAGANLYFNKPIEPRVLAEKDNSILKKSIYGRSDYQLLS